ncbi:hypothetical protein EV210_102170 [Anaerospora hongkongensis]|uniref:Uncharacterized protein n=1 Tax=Anaerospora hongkongensis TaxID=244830 RepID=A0A4R1Q0P8_9FIRM|nr:hypothetical protein [Anaerospora hongkongensis]TCL39260.1 hypothetical protein EV210_102170 [Anaerospora hongkongensis]
MKKIIYIAMLLCCLSLGNLAFAAGEQQKAQAPADAAATNLVAGYTAAKEKLPPVPVPPASLQDAKATAAYIAAVDAYLKASQKYIDSAGNDANAIIKERNTAIESANQVVADYNAFFKIEEKK